MANRYRHEHTDYKLGALIRRQHFVTDTRTGVPFLRTIDYSADGEVDRQVADFLEKACVRLNDHADVATKASGVPAKAGQNPDPARKPRNSL